MSLCVTLPPLSLSLSFSTHTKILSLTQTHTDRGRKVVQAFYLQISFTLAVLAWQGKLVLSILITVNIGFAKTH